MGKLSLILSGGNGRGKNFFTIFVYGNSRNKRRNCQAPLSRNTGAYRRLRMLILQAIHAAAWSRIKRCISLHFVAFRCISLHFVAFRCISLHSRWVWCNDATKPLYPIQHAPFGVYSLVTYG
jgi:hypothetical protein